MQQDENIPKKKTFKDLTTIPSIGNLTARTLISAGYDSTSKLKKSDVEELASIEKIGERLAKRIIQDIKKGATSDEKKKENTNFEIRCPVCDKFTWVEDDKCRECEEPIEFFSSVILPEKGIIEDPKKTLAQVEEKILDEGGDAESWFIKGSILESMGANRKALESFDKVIELDPLFDYVWNAKAQVSLKIGETEEAAKAYKLAFDARKAPKDIADQFKKAKTSTPKETIELKEKDELHKKLEDKISIARKLIKKLGGKDKDITEMTAELDTITEEKIKGNKKKALQMVDEVIKECQSSLDMEDEREDISNRIQKVNELSKELSEDIKKIIGIKDDISQAEDSLEEEDLEKASDLISSYLENESSLRYISENLDKKEDLKNKIEDMDVKVNFLDYIDKEFEKVKEFCRNEDYQKAEKIFEDLMNKLDESLEYIERVTEKYLKEIEEIIEKGEKKGFDLEIVKNDFEELKERFKTGDEDKEEITSQFEVLKKKAKNTLLLRTNMSETKDELSEHKKKLDTSKYEERIEKIEDEFKNENFEKAVTLSKELKKDIKTEIKKVEEKERLESKAEENLVEARKKLSRLRETNFDLTDLKRLLKDSNDHRKKGDLKKSVTLTENFIDSAEKLIELSDVIKKIDTKIEELDESDLVDKERINYEVDQYKKLVKIEKYGLANKFLSKTLDELEVALDEKKKIPQPEEKLDKSATQIPTQIKEKVRNVKELNNLVENAEIEIKVNREPLKDAIIKIKDLKYIEANKILNDWKESLIDRLNYELGNRLDAILEDLEDFDIPSVQRRGKAILENVEKKWNLKAYKEALEVLIYASNFIQEVQKKKTKKDKQIYLASELIKDTQGLGDTKEIEDIFIKVRENKEDDETFEKSLEELKNTLEERLTDTMNEEVEKLEDTLEQLNRKNVVLAINNLIDLKSSLDEENAEKASWYIREYKETLKKS